MKRLVQAQYGRDNIERVSNKVVRKLLFGKIKHNETVVEGEERRKIAVINYSHGLGHRFMKVADMFDIQVIFKFIYKLNNFPAQINPLQIECQMAKSTHTVFGPC